MTGGRRGVGRRLDAEWRIGTYYAVLFAAVGAAAPFVALWLDARGVDPGAIGTILAAPSLVMLLTTVRIGRHLDVLADRRRGIVVLNVLILAAHVTLAYAHATWAILLVWTIGGVLTQAMVPATDALALGVARRRGSDWARTRVFGSVGFIVAVLAGGALYERLGIGAFLPVLITLAALRLIVSAALPALPRASPDEPARASLGTPMPAPTATAPTAAQTAAPIVAASPDPAPPGGDALAHPGVLLTIGGAALINASHGLFYAFGLLDWSRAGIGETLGSALWSIGVIAEIALMWRFRAIAGRWSARACLLVAGGAGVVRWLLSALEPPLAVLFAAQMLHALTFGLMFLATGQFIARRVGERDAGRGQALSATFVSGAMAAAMWTSGLLYERVGTSAYAAMALSCVLGMLLVAASYRTSLDR